MSNTTLPIRIINLEVQHETMKRQVEEPFVGNDIFGMDEDGQNHKLIIWNRIMRLEEGQQIVQKHVQELFANVMDFELQSRGEPCHLHDEGLDERVNIKLKLKWKDVIEKSFKESKVIGIKYLTSSHTPSVSLLWSLLLLLSMMVCGVFVFHLYCMWRVSPTTTSHDTLAPLALIPFPAVTVCPERNIGAHFPLDRLLDQCNQYACTRDQIERLSAASFLCPSLMQNIPLQAWSNYFNSSTPEFIEELIPACFEDISAVQWPDRAVGNCSRAFQTLYIDDRVCYSYNLLPADHLFKEDLSPRPAVMDDTGLLGRSDWKLDSMYRPDAMDKAVPVHVDSAGESYRLTMGLDRKTSHQPSCMEEPFQAYEIAVHHPFELPSRALHPYLRVPPAHALYVAVTPRLVKVAGDGCVPQQDRRLRMFRGYSQNNCRLECRVSCSLSLCGCVPLYLPRADNSTQWCGTMRRYCPDSLVPDLMKNKITWDIIAKHYRKEIRDDLREEITDYLYNFPGQEALTEEVLQSLAPNCSCNCPPECSSLAYHVVTQLVPLRQRMDSGSRSDKSEVHVYYKEGQDLFTVTERRNIFTFTEFLAACGGLVALFTGLSVLAVAELLFLLLSRAAPQQQLPADDSSEQDCLRRRQEWDKTVQTDPLFITDGTLTMGY